MAKILGAPYYLENDLDHQTAAGADCDFLAIAEVGERDLELVATWAWVGVEGGGLVIGHVFNLYLIVERHRAGSCFDGCRQETEERRYQRHESRNSSNAGTEIILVPNLSPTRHKNIERG